MSHLKDKVALITGAGQGVGQGIALALANAGAKVAVTGRTLEKLEATCGLIQERGGKAIALEANVKDAGDLSRIVEATVAELGGLDILVNNAGVYLDKGKGLLDADFDDWLQSFNINSVAPFRMVKALYSSLKAAQGAKVLTRSSQMGALSRNVGGAYAYCASKAAVNKGMQGLAVDLKSENITLAVAHPGWVQTDMGGGSADITPEESAAGLFNVIQNMSLAKTGSFYKWNGEIHAW